MLTYPSAYENLLDTQRSCRLSSDLHLQCITLTDIIGALSFIASPGAHLEDSKNTVCRPYTYDDQAYRKVM